jgi:hypothetical protein
MPRTGSRQSLAASADHNPRPSPARGSLQYGASFDTRAIGRATQDDEDFCSPTLFVTLSRERSDRVEARHVILQRLP